MASLKEQVLRRKPRAGDGARNRRRHRKSELKRTVGLWGLSAIGIGGTIGTGIFFILSQAVPIAGPAVIWSFVLSAVVAGLTAVCYAELAGAVPVAGSSYSYAYTTLGEVVAVGVGACLLLEWGWPTTPTSSPYCAPRHRRYTGFRARWPSAYRSWHASWSMNTTATLPRCGSGATPDGREVLLRLKRLSGFGEQKARIFLALLGKQYGLTAVGWQEAAGEYGKAGTYISVADVRDRGSLEQVRSYKKQMKAAAKAAKTAGG